MKKFFKKMLTLIMCFFVTTILGNPGVKIANADENSEKHTIWIIGDSTVSAFNDNYYYPRYGYGTMVDQFIDSNAYEVKNLALSGRSSKSYILDNEYTTLINGMNDGDYLIIGFGHNDEKGETARYTNPNGTYEDEGSFANSLYENYIKPAEQKGCKTILCTPIVRRSASGSWMDSELHITSTNGEFEGGDYPQAIRDLGEDLDIPVVDMTALTKEVYDELGPSGTLYLHAWTSSSSSSVDNTHTNIWGGKYNAYLVCKTIKELGVEGISDAVLDDKIAEAPSKADNLISNPEYSEPEYNPNLAQSELWDDAGIWKGTVFGGIGAAPDKFSYTLEGQENGNVNIAVRGNKGKISATVDGIAMYYYKVPVSKNFTLTATATINSITLNDQVSFGLMARDEMYIDTVNANLMGDYVAAGPLKITKTSPWNCFARKSGTLTQGGTVTNTTFEPGQSIDLRIESNSDGYACTMGDEQTITGGFDFALTAIDSNYVYVGMFVARNADITFSNIKLLVDGVEVKLESGDDSDDGDNEELVLNTEELDTVISEVQAASNSVKVSEDGKDVSKLNKWTYQEALDTLNDAVLNAQNVKENATSQEEIDTAVSDLNSALEIFNSTLQNGTKKTSSHKHSAGNSSDTDKDYAVSDKNDKEENKAEADKEEVSGWYQSEGKRFFRENDGSIKKGWYKDNNGNWFMLNRGNGSMMTGWFKDSDENYYYLNSTDGKMITGWFNENNQWYYLNPVSNGYKGAMMTGWVQADGKWYYMNSQGVMLYNTVVDGYNLGLDGALI